MSFGIRSNSCVYIFLTSWKLGVFKVIYQKKSGAGIEVNVFAVWVAVLVLSLASSPQAWGAITNQTQNTTHNTIQAAIDAAADGDEISLDADTYTESLSIAGKGLTITGASESSVIIQAGESLNPAANVFTINAAGFNITLQYLTIRHGDYGIRSRNGNVNVLNCTFINNGYDGVAYPDPLTQAAADVHWNTHATNGGAMRIENSQASEIAFCTLIDNDRGIRYQDGDNGNIHDNTISGALQAGIYLAASTYNGQSGCTNTVVTNNTSSNNAEHGLLSIGGWNNSFTGNTCNNNWNTGIMLWHPGEITVQNNSFDGNNIYSHNGWGANGDAKGTIYAAGEVGDAAATFDFKILDNTIANGFAGNQASANGLNLTSSAGAGITVTGNTFSGMDIDIHVLEQAATTVVNNNLLSAAIGILNEDTDVLDATRNWWGDASGPGGEGPGTGAAVTGNVDFGPWWANLAMSTGAELPTAQFALRTPTVKGPNEPIKVYLDVTSTQPNIATVGTRITYDVTKVDFDSFAMGSGVPSTWSAVYSKTDVAGEIDLVIADVSFAAATVTGPATAVEAIILTFSRIGTGCAGSAFDFNSTPSTVVSAFPATHYIHFLDADTASVVLQEPALSELTSAAALTGVSGPVMEDHSLIRGNINNRSAHNLNISDVIDLAAYLYQGLVLDYNCEAAVDTNNDGAVDITDLVTLAQGIFNSTLITIPPPNSTNPGVGIAAAVVPDGGSIPSVLGCVDGESCP